MFSKIRIFAIAAAAFSLSACASVPPHQMQMSAIQSLKLVAVEVTGGNQVVSWPDEEQAAIKKGLLTQDEIHALGSTSAKQFPKIHPHFTAILQARFEGQLRNQLGNDLNGTTPVKAVVDVQLFDIPSLIRRMLVDQGAKLKANISLVEMKTGQVLARYEGPQEVYFMLGGASAIAQTVANAVTENPEDHSHHMVRSYVSAYKRWLLPR